jgi:hypothetical protein
MTHHRFALRSLALSLTASTLLLTSPAPSLAAAPRVTDLRDLGYSDVERVASEGDVSVYRISEERRGAQMLYTLAVLRPISDEEPIIKDAAASSADSRARDRQAQRAGGTVPNPWAFVPVEPPDSLIERLIAPWVRKQLEAAGVAIQVQVTTLHYASNFRVMPDPRLAEAGLRAVKDPATGQPAAYPLAMVLSTAGFVPGKGLTTWASTPVVGNSTIAEIKQRVAAEQMSPEEKAREHRERVARVSQEKEARDRAYEAQRKEVHARNDATNPLASLGYDSARLLFREGKATYFWATANGTGHWKLREMVVVLNEVAENEPVVQLVPVPGKAYLRYTDARIAFVQQRLMPMVLALKPDLRSLGIHHHVKGVRLPPTERFRIDTHTTAGFGFDQPLFIEDYLPPPEGGTWKPRYIVAPFPEPGLYPTLSEDRVTLAQARALRGQQIEQTRVASLSKADRVAEQRAKRLQAQAQRPTNFVYKSDRSWASKPGFEVPREIFNGNYDKPYMERRLPEHFARFVETYSAKCEGYVEEPRMKLTITTQTVTVNHLGLEVGSGPQRERVIYVEERFWDKYEEFRKEVGETRARNFASAVFTDFGKAAENIWKYNLDLVNDMFAHATSWQSFFEENACTSVSVTQMRENMLRAATDRPSLQAAKQGFKGAAAESEPLSPPPEQRSIFDGCYEANEFMKSEFCMCMDSGSRDVMTPAERSRYAADFFRYYSENVTAAKTGPQDRRWALQGILDGCRRFN